MMELKHAVKVLIRHNGLVNTTTNKPTFHFPVGGGNRTQHLLRATH